MQTAWYQPGGLLWVLPGLQHIDEAPASMMFDKWCLKQGFGL